MQRGLEGANLVCLGGGFVGEGEPGHIRHSGTSDGGSDVLGNYAQKKRRSTTHLGGKEDVCFSIDQKERKRQSDSETASDLGAGPQKPGCTKSKVCRRKSPGKEGGGSMDSSETPYTEGQGVEELSAKLSKKDGEQQSQMERRAERKTSHSSEDLPTFSAKRGKGRGRP